MTDRGIVNELKKITARQGKQRREQLGREAFKLLQTSFDETSPKLIEELDRLKNTAARLHTSYQCSRKWTLILLSVEETIKRMEAL